MSVSKQIVILGMHRSGTSMLSKILSLAGVNMGEDDGIRDISNVDGHIEDEVLLRINENILFSLDSTWDSPPTITKVDENESSIISIYEEYAISKSGVWGVKEPRLALFIDQFSKVLDNPYYIYIKRDGLDVANSLKVRNFFSTEKSLELKSIYDSRIESFLGNKKSFNVDYNELVKNPGVVVKQLCDFIGIDYSTTYHAKVKTAKELKKGKRKVFVRYILQWVIRLVRDPRKIFKKKSITIVKTILLRVKEII
ncbi:sulfotransferase [Vibrio gigantis]|uniref:sulfotransferase n=1 Tax=Vibrio gigantis TaxID=296199 RepID=UPI003D0BFB16